MALCWPPKRHYNASWKNGASDQNQSDPCVHGRVSIEGQKKRQTGHSSRTSATWMARPIGGFVTNLLRASFSRHKQKGVVWPHSAHNKKTSENVHLLDTHTRAHGEIRSRRFETPSAHHQNNIASPVCAARTKYSYGPTKKMMMNIWWMYNAQRRETMSLFIGPFDTITFFPWHFCPFQLIQLIKLQRFRVDGSFKLIKFNNLI